MDNCRYCFLLIFIFVEVNLSSETCDQETTFKGTSVLWPKANNGSFVTSKPKCFNSNGTIIKRYCNHTSFIPIENEMPNCIKLVDQYEVTNCPPGYHKISENITRFCYQIHEASIWNNPCYRLGGNEIITDLNEEEIDALFFVLRKMEIKLIWLPAHRRKSFHPVTWAVPGKDWGVLVTGNSLLDLKDSIFKNCLALDVNNKVLITNRCDDSLQSICLITTNPLPMQCPPNYFSFRFKDPFRCFGVEMSNTSGGSNWESFKHNQCKTPMLIESEPDVLIFLTVAERINLTQSLWCWFQLSKNESLDPQTRSEQYLRGAINQRAESSLVNPKIKLGCMVCEKSATINATEIEFKYNSHNHKLQLTIYFPSGLWKDDTNEKGIQCFSNAGGFSNVIEIDNVLEIGSEGSDYNDDLYETEMLGSSNVEKVIYTVTPILNVSGQYWCEAHTTNFTFIKTKPILVEQQNLQEHVFSVVISISNNIKDNYSLPDVTETMAEVSELLGAENVILMDILDINQTEIKVLLHAYIQIQFDEDTLPTRYKEYIIKLESEFSQIGIKFISISSSTHCLPSQTQDVIELHWPLTRLHNIVAPKQFCLQENGLPVTRTCIGSYLLGAVWGEVEGSCSQNYEASNTTTYLYKFAQRHTSNEDMVNFLSNGLTTTLDDLDNIIPADIVYLSMSLKNILHYLEKNESTSLMDPHTFNTIVWTMNRIMELDWNYLRLAQTLNSTNVILDSVDEILDYVTKYGCHALTKNTNESLTNSNYKLTQKSRYIVQISSSQMNGISGLALIKNTNSNSFSDMKVEPLLQNVSIGNVLSLKNLELAAWVPNIVLNSIRPASDLNQNSSNIHIIISIFHDDAVFQQITEVPLSVNSRIIGISIPDYDTNLRYPVIIILKELKEHSAKQFCGFWDFDTHNSGDYPGFWNDDGCFLLDRLNNFSICLCYHLTHFGQLVFWNSNSNLNQHGNILNIITLIGCILSLVGISGIWITAFVFQTWRKKPGTKILIQLSLAISLPLILMIFISYHESFFETFDNHIQLRNDRYAACIFVGSALHYSILSSFTWMLITAILQFMRFVRVLGIQRPQNYMFKYSIIGWGLPLVPVLILLVINKDSYIPKSIALETETYPICYPTGNYLIFALLLPIAFILTVNICLFIRVMFSIVTGPDGKVRTDCLIGAQLKLSIFLFFLLGLSWVFGFLSYTDSFLLWSYLFCITSTLQGFVLFVFFVVCNPNTRDLWLSLMQLKNLNLRDFSTSGTDLPRSNSISSNIK